MRLGDINKQTYYPTMENNEMTNNPWQCMCCGDCCRVLSQTGARVTKKEWVTLEKDIYNLKLDIRIIELAKQNLALPTKGKRSVKKCAFITNTNECQIYNRRPRICREFPLWITEHETLVLIEVFLLCPRAERLAEVLKNNPPEWIRELIGERQYRIVLV